MTRSKIQAHPTEISHIPRLKPNAHFARNTLDADWILDQQRKLH